MNRLDSKGLIFEGVRSLFALSASSKSCSYSVECFSQLSCGPHDKDKLIAAYQKGKDYSSDSSLSLKTFTDLPAVMAEKQEAAAIFSQDADKTIGDLSKKWNIKDGSATKAVMHGISGAITAKLGGGNPAVGAAVEMANEFAIPTLDQLAQKAGFKPGTVAYDSALRLGSFGLGSVVGTVVGGSGYTLPGAGIAETATENNYLKHAELQKYALALEKCWNIKDAKSCSEVKRWEKLSQDRDNALLNACVSQPNKSLCQSLKDEAIKADKEYAKAFNGRFGTYLGKNIGWSNGGPGEIYLDNSPYAALQNVAAAEKLSRQIEAERKNPLLDSAARNALSSILSQILTSKDIDLGEKVNALEFVYNNVSFINRVLADPNKMFNKLGAAQEFALIESGGNAADYLRMSGKLFESTSVALSGAEGAYGIATAVAVPLVEHVSKVGTAKAVAVVGGIAAKLGKKKFDPQKGQNVEVPSYPMPPADPKNAQLGYPGNLKGSETLANNNPTASGLVGYGETDLSLAVINPRATVLSSDKGLGEEGKNMAYVGGKNFAAFEFVNKKGQKEVRVFVSDVGMHSEDAGAAFIMANGIDPRSVTRIYTERGPCGYKGCNVKMGQWFENAKVTYSFMYDTNFFPVTNARNNPSASNARTQGTKDLLATVKAVMKAKGLIPMESPKDFKP